MIIFDFRCKNCDAVTEHLVNHSDEASSPCPECGSSDTVKIIGTPNLAYALMATNGESSSDGMTSAIDKWHKARMQRKATETKNMENHGTVD